jgi:tetratricopeptide (TPR) repeat protein
MEEVTPLFAFHAQQAINRGQLHDAVELCAHGIRQFPDYLSGYVVLAKAYDALGMTTDARLIRSAAIERFTFAVFPEYQATPAEQPEVSIDTPSTQPSNQSEPPPELPNQASEPPQTVTIAPPLPPSAAHSMQPLQLITVAPATEGRVIRASSVRLIPGLEFTSLRFEGAKTRGRRIIQHLIDPPPFRSFHAPLKPTRIAGQGASVTAAVAADVKRPLSLEQLAARLERARMPRPAEIVKQASVEIDVTAASTLVTDTIAGIYLAQGALDKALEAYKQLQAAHPDRHHHYQQRIDDVLRRMTP